MHSVCLNTKEEKTMKRMKTLSVILCCLLVCAFLFGCTSTEKPADAAPAQSEAPAPSAVEPSTQGSGEAAPVVNETPVVIYAANIFNSLNPYLAIGYPDLYIASNVYETLVSIDKDGIVCPKLAKSWEISDDALTYTFHLIEDAYFHNGENLKAFDVVFTYEYAKNYPSSDKYISMVESVKALDDYTVEFKLKYASPLFLTYTEDMYIFNEKFVNEDDNDMKDTTCGTGPYKVESFDAATSCFLVANEDYRTGAPAIKNAEIRYISDSASAAVSFEAGEITIMDVPIAQAQVLIDSGKYNYQLVAPLHTAVIVFNVTVPPFDNKLIRQAFSYAADKETMIQVAREGFGQVARIQAGTNCFGVDFSLAEDISYNPEKAKALLAEAGYPDGMDLADFGVVFKTIAGGYHEKIAQVFQQNLADIGVKVEIISTETPDEDAAAGDFAIMNEGLSYRADFSHNQSQYTTKAIGSANFSQMSDPYVDEMFEKGDLETDPEVRKQIYRELIAYIIDYCPSIPIMHRQSIYMWDKNLNASVYDNAARPYRIYEWSWNH